MFGKAGQGSCERVDEAGAEAAGRPGFEFAKIQVEAYHREAGVQ
jgi:hypothetical protein